MKTPKAPRMVTIAVITTTTIIFWVFFEIYRVFTTSPPVNVPSELMKSISPSLDTVALDNIHQRIYLEEEEIPETLIGVPLLLSPTPTQTPTPATGSAEISTASPSAETPVLSPTPTPTEAELP